MDAEPIVHTRRITHLSRSGKGDRPSSRSPRYFWKPGAQRRVLKVEDSGFLLHCLLSIHCIVR